MWRRILQMITMTGFTGFCSFLLTGLVWGLWASLLWQAFSVQSRNIVFGSDQATPPPTQTRGDATASVFHSWDGVFSIHCAARYGQTVQHLFLMTKQCSSKRLVVMMVIAWKLQSGFFFFDSSLSLRDSLWIFQTNVCSSLGVYLCLRRFFFKYVNTRVCTDACGAFGCF